jgi:hypothetical protein
MLDSTRNETIPLRMMLYHATGPIIKHTGTALFFLILEHAPLDSICVLSVRSTIGALLDRDQRRGNYDKFHFRTPSSEGDLVVSTLQYKI